MSKKSTARTGTIVLLCIFSFLSIYRTYRRVKDKIAISKYQEFNAGLSQTGIESFMNTAVMDSLFSDGTRYLLLLTRGQTARPSLDGYLASGISPENTIVVYHRSDTTFHSHFSHYPTVSGDRLGVGFMHRTDDIQLFSINKNKTGYSLRYVSGQQI